MKLLLSIILFVPILFSCSSEEKHVIDRKKVEDSTNEISMKYSSVITFLTYKDFEYGIQFMEDVLQLDLVLDKGFARVYQVNQKAYLGIVQKGNNEEQPGNTLFSLTTSNVDSEFERVSKLEVENLTELKIIESIPLKSFFFDDKEGHKFEIQQFLKDTDFNRF